MAGVNSLLKAAAHDMQQTEKAQVKSSERKTKTLDQTEQPSPEQHEEVQTKHRGRPFNKAKGIATRAQHTITLKDEDYQKFLEYANEHDMSFAKLVEKATVEYIKNHE